MRSSASWTSAGRRSTATATPPAAAPATTTGAQPEARNAATAARARASAGTSRIMRGSLRSEEKAIDAVAQAVQRQEVHLLDARGHRVRDRDVHVGEGEVLADLAATAAGERDHLHVALVRGADRGDDVGRVPAGGDREQH